MWNCGVNRTWRALMAMSLLVAHLAGLSLASSAAKVSSTSSSNASTQNKLPGMVANPFVLASPLVCAIVCRDGVLLVAAHVNVDDEEPLLYYRNEDKMEPPVNLKEASSKLETDLLKSKNNSSDPQPSSSESTSSCAFLDLPENFQGPFRIHSIDTFGRCIVSAGWRADCDSVVHHIRRIADQERMVYGSHDPQDESVVGSTTKYLATELSTHLAKCAVSQRTRTLACASLFVSPPASSDSHSCGQVWLVDSTGAYPVRALCIGGGNVVMNGEMTLAADAVNERLLSFDWSAMGMTDAVKTLLHILNGSSPSDTTQKVGLDQDSRILSRNTRLEVAFVGGTASSSMVSGVSRRKLKAFAFADQT